MINDFVSACVNWSCSYWQDLWSKPFFQVGQQCFRQFYSPTVYSPIMHVLPSIRCHFFCFVLNWIFYSDFFSCCGLFLLHFQQKKKIFDFFFYLLQPTSLISVNHPFPKEVIFFSSYLRIVIIWFLKLSSILYQQHATWPWNRINELFVWPIQSKRFVFILSKSARSFTSISYKKKDF